MVEKGTETTKSAPPVYIVSGSMGASGEQLVRTILAQFENVHVPVKIVPRIHDQDQIERVVKKAASNNGIIVHTLVNSDLRRAMIDQAKAQNVFALDMVGPLIEHLVDLLDQVPIGKPGLYRQLHESYFKRIEAIEFTTLLDDGMHYEKWREAEIVLVGISRVGKTPLSLYLSILGWKVANVPLLPDVPPPEELFRLDRRRVIGLTIDPSQLLLHRQHRQRSLGVSGSSSYTDPVKIYEDLEEARRIFRRGGFPAIDITDKPIETCADEIIATINRRLKLKAR
jgi:regulator of PEP synthase PpsR (kinase-PPPase family)